MVEAEIVKMGDIRIRNVIDEDLPIFFEYQREPEANCMAAFRAREREEFMSHWATIRSDPTVVVRSVLFGEHVAGNILKWEREGQWLIGYWIGQKFWGKGIATQALSKFLILIDHRPLYAYVSAQNFASIQVLQRCGFARCSQESAMLPTADDGIHEIVFILGGKPTAQ